MKKLVRILPYIGWYTLIGLVVYFLDHYCHRFTDRYFWFRQSVESEKVFLISIAFLSFKYGTRTLRFFVRWYQAVRFIHKHKIN